MAQVKPLRAIAAALILLPTLTSCTTHRWIGILYPDKDNLTDHMLMGHFETLEQCRERTLMVILRLSHMSQSTYECALNCERPRSMDAPMVCERTSL